MLADGIRLLASVEQDETGRLATVRPASPLSEGDVVVDLLFASSGIEPEIGRAAEMTDVVPGLCLPVAMTGHLIALKLPWRNCSGYQAIRRTNPGRTQGTVSESRDR